MIDGHPEYIVFNGKTKSLNDKMQVNVGEKVRLYVGNGGVNLISSFHVIGEIFDNVYPEVPSARNRIAISKRRLCRLEEPVLLSLKLMYRENILSLTML